MKKKPKAKIILTNDEAEFIHNLIIANQSVMTNTIRRTLGNASVQLYEECISETYLAACENIKVLKKHENPAGWLVVAAKLTSLKLMEQNARELTNPRIDDVLKGKIGRDTSEEALYNIWMEENVPQKLIDQLTKREKEIYDLIYIKKKSVNEISKELNISKSTIWNIHKSIREKIKYAVDKNLF